ncbi:hypothetical protein [Chitinophaga polysaccharea]|uniref:hypothetical protein n=1 Tax=Chitinophaga polysaccharea TaxID=1293035 RepID=UPI0011594A0C|nr:hypothetical protein [Chitinophaga polysaccharea]
MRVKTIASAAGFALLLSACQKTTKLSPSPQDSPEGSAPSQTMTLTVNNTNPFNFVGASHNAALDLIGNNQNFATLTDQAVHNIVEGFSNSSLSIDPTSFATLANAVEYANYSLAESLNIPNELKTVGSISEDVRQKLLALQSALGINMPLTGITSISDAKTPNQATTDVQALELSIIQQYGAPTTLNLNRTINLTTNDGKATYLLIACAIGKYSYYYWHEKLNQPTSNWYVVFDQSDNTVPGLLPGAMNTLGIGKVLKAVGNWFARTGADIGGFVSAGSVGAGASRNPETGKVTPNASYNVKLGDGIKAGKEASGNKRAEQQG